MQNEIIKSISSIKVTRVVNIRQSEFDVFIGRPGRWGNPFRIGPDGSREDVIIKHKEWLDGVRKSRSGRNPPTKDEIRKYLQGKRLGCFCAPKACHGDNYVKICRGER